MSRPAIGILGGTFNPVHVGHLRGALDCRDLLGLDSIRLMPARLPPLKATPGVSAAQRARMLDLAVEGMEGLTVDRRELDREGLSFTVDTLRELRQELGPEVVVVFIMGADSLQRLNRWQDWELLLDHANIAVLSRSPGDLQLPPELQGWLKEHEVPPSQLLNQAEGAVTRLLQPALDISSSALRLAVAGGRNVRYLLPDRVLEYINDHGLYRSAK
ncbi:nicotinate-nucleotide adenylyltransferase [Luminiphilus sp. nBUS_07]|uniref:nicotinate-nucleotide adenylyltransferase n=1 Tax=Luminiphilus sp. nBUS_07 TaxID=3395314 RepID=UPI003EC08231